MGFFQVFRDLPQIKLDYEAPINGSYAWPSYGEDCNYDLVGARQSMRTVNVFGTELPLETSDMALSSMQRYLTNAERPLFDTAFMQADPRGPDHSQHLRHPIDYNKPPSPQSPWPLPEGCHRHPSPGETILSSSSGSLSAFPSDELRASGYSPRSSLSSQTEASSQAISRPDALPFERYSRDIPAGCGSSGVSLNMIQQYPDLTPSVEELEGADVKPAYCSYEQQDNYYVNTKMEVDSEPYAQHHESDAYNRSIRDGESVHPCPLKGESIVQDEDPSDPDYQPTSPSTKRSRRTSSQSSGTSTKSSSKRGNATQRARKSSSASTSGDNHRVAKKVRSRASASSPAADNSNAARPFPCPFAPYGCSSTFTSKNEWKRHVSTQHIRLGFWRCDLCPHQSDNGYNDFNRKDLFTQHLRRMHARTPIFASQKNGKTQGANKTPEEMNTSNPNSDYHVTEANLSVHQNRCYRVLRTPPPRSSCLFCPKQFKGEGSWEERMEHVCHHFERDRKGGGQPAKPEHWKEDDVLRNWLLEEGLVEPDGKGGWKLGNGRPKRPELCIKQEDDEDGDGEEE